MNKNDVGSTAQVFRGAFPNDRGVEYVGQGQYDQAIAEFTKAIQQNPIYGRAYYNRGTIYARQGQTDLAIQH